MAKTLIQMNNRSIRCLNLGQFSIYQTAAVRFFKWAILGLFFVYFWSFQTINTNLQQINVKKCPSSIRCRDSNSQPSDYESPPLTTKPGLPPQTVCFISKIIFFNILLGANSGLFFIYFTFCSSNFCTIKL